MWWSTTRPEGWGGEVTSPPRASTATGPGTVCSVRFSAVVNGVDEIFAVTGIGYTTRGVAICLTPDSVTSARDSTSGTTPVHVPTRRASSRSRPTSLPDWGCVGVESSRLVEPPSTLFRFIRKKFKHLTH